MVARAGHEEEGGAGQASGNAPPAVLGNLTEEVFLKAAREMSAFKDEQAALSLRKKTARKRMRAEGIDLGHLDAALKLAPRPRLEVKDHFAVQHRYAQWLGLPVGTQGDMFGASAGSDDEQRARVWWEDGRAKRRAGLAKKLPDDCGARYVPFWDNGYALKDFVWDREQEAADAQKASGDKPGGEGGAGGGGAETRKRGRPKASKVAGAISPPPATHSAPDAKPIDGTGKGVAADDTLPPEDGFGRTGFGVVEGGLSKH